MVYKLLIAEEANNDLDNALRYLKNISLELAAQFYLNIKQLYKRIVNNPQQFPIINEHIRRTIVPRFQY